MPRHSNSLALEDVVGRENVVLHTVGESELEINQLVDLSVNWLPLAHHLTTI